MRKIFLFYFVLFGVFLFAQEKTKIIDKTKYIVTYSFRYQKDSTSKVYRESTKLLLGKKSSLFQSVNGMFNDSLLYANKSIIKSGDVTSFGIASALSERKKTSLKYKIHKQNNKITTYDVMYYDKYLYREETFFKWQITSDTLTINTYKCNKAIATFSGREYVAWFSREIPISDGPYKFNGLPGLILKIYDNKNQFTFEMQSFIKKEKDIVLYEDVFTSIGKRQEVTKQEYFKAIKTYKKDPISYKLNHGEIFHDNNREIRYRQIEESANRYKSNPIELIIE